MVYYQHEQLHQAIITIHRGGVRALRGDRQRHVCPRSVTQTTLVDWLVKGGLIAGIVFLLNVVLGFLSKRDK